MKKTLTISGKKIEFTTSAATPILYNMQFPKHDLMKELMAMSEEDYDVNALIRLAYIMSGAFRKGKNLEDWLEQFEMLDFFEILPDILSFWTENAETNSVVDKSKNA